MKSRHSDELLLSVDVPLGVIPQMSGALALMRLLIAPGLELTGVKG